MEIQLTHEIAETLNGRYSVKFYPNGGEAKLQTKNGSQPWSDIESASAKSVKILTFDFAGDVRAILTGSATIYLDKITG